EDVEQLLKQWLFLPQRGEGLVKRVSHLFAEDEDEEFFFGLAIQKESAGTDVGALSNLAGGGSLEALSGEQRSGGTCNARQLIELVALAPAQGVGQPPVAACFAQPVRGPWLSQHGYFLSMIIYEHGHLRQRCEPVKVERYGGGITKS